MLSDYLMGMKWRFDPIFFRDISKVKNIFSDYRIATIIPLYN